MLCSSGVEEFRFGELRELLGLRIEELDNVLLEDSDALGSLGVRGAVAQLYDESAENVMVTHGSSEAIFLTITSLLKAGDEVVVMWPCYQSLYTLAESIGCVMKPWRLEFDSDFIPSIDSLRTLVTERTRLIVVNSPNNPTGSLLDKGQCEALLCIAESVGCFVLWDDAFNDLVLYGRSDIKTMRSKREIRIGTLSKNYGLPGLRVGWCLAGSEVLSMMLRRRDYLTLNLSPLVEVIAARALQARCRLLELRLPRVRGNLDLLRAWCSRHSEHIAWVEPRGGVSAFPRLLSVNNADAFCRDIATTKNVFILPGSCFGEEQHFRIGFGGSPQLLELGLQRIADFLQVP